MFSSLSESRDMKVNPQQAPLYGRCVITVQLSDEELARDEEGVDYFLLFAGSTQRHLTSTLRSSHDTLQALCPAHDCCEVVLVTLCSAGRDVPEDPEDPEDPDIPKPRLGCVAPLAEHRFSFVQDLAFDMAQFLVSNKTQTPFPFFFLGENTRAEACNRSGREKWLPWLRVMQQCRPSDSKTTGCHFIVSSLARLPSQSPWCSINEIFLAQ
uniref:Uncharacterized protein n=1 Tax=Labrus bergylta TaxID=56723 RepID=A0A3Q3GTL1_9LABR